MEKIMEFLTGTATAPVWLWLALLAFIAVLMAVIVWCYFNEKRLKERHLNECISSAMKNWEANKRAQNRIAALQGQLKKKTDELREDALEYASRSGGSPDAVMSAAKKYYRFLIGKE